MHNNYYTCNYHNAYTFSRHEDSIFANSQVMESDGDSNSFIKVWFNTTIIIIIMVMIRQIS